MSQAALGAIGGVLKQAQLKYETDARTPSADYMAAIATAGFDVLYILTGVASPPSGVREDAHMFAEAQLREPSGEGPMHRLLDETMQRKAEYHGQRSTRIAAMLDHLAMCQEDDFVLFEALLARLANTAASTQQ